MDITLKLTEQKAALLAAGLRALNREAGRSLEESMAITALFNEMQDSCAPNPPAKPRPAAAKDSK